MSVPSDLRYSKSHEWVRLDGDEATIGITDYAQHELGDVVYLDLPKPGAAVAVEQVFGSVESVKAVSELYAPIAGEVVRVNEELADAPEGINSSPYGTGWLIVLKLSDPKEVDSLLDAADYEAYLAELGS